MPTPCWLKHLCSIRALVPVSFFLSLSLSLSPSLSFSGWSPGAQRLSEFTFLPGLLRPSREGGLRLHPIERAPEASVNRASPMSGALLAFCVNQGISASFSLLYFLIGPLQTTRFWSIKGPQQGWRGRSPAEHISFKYTYTSTHTQIHTHVYIM